MESKITVMVEGKSRVELVQNLRAFADNLDGTPAGTNGKVAGKTTTTTTTTTKKAAAPVEEAADEDDGFVTETASDGGFDDDTTIEDDGEGFTETTGAQGTGSKKAAGKAKPKKLTLDDVNDACKAHAAAKGRPATLAVLQKKFKTQSVTALKPEQYEACISAMAVN